ncbi:hypothetical protein FE257_003376 [Aspergillus nanangensis]|uniref:Myb-like domain-containing protein n=1 Tax=Aspergillus nanangensis TaxID=2582783 RepID=A0AAD4GPN6_ASPNN|nr:hypothetical protein FE257_003376 [Aspergillus nanangensis]
MPPVFHVDGFRRWTPPSRQKSSPSQPARLHPPSNRFPAIKHPQAPLSQESPVPKHQLPARPPAAVCVNANPVELTDTSRDPQSPSQKSSGLASDTMLVTPSDTECTVRLEQPPKNRVIPSSNLDLATSWDVAHNAPIEEPSFRGHIARYIPHPSVSGSDDSLQELVQPVYELYEQNDVPIDPVILTSSGPWQMEDEDRHIHAEDVIISGTIGSYPDPPPIVYDTHSQFLHSSADPEMHEEISLSDSPIHSHKRSQHLIDGNDIEDTPTTQSRQPRMGKIAEPNESPLGDSQKKSSRDDMNRAGPHKRSLGKTDKPEKESCKRKRQRRNVTSSTETSHTSLRSHFLSLPTNERLEFLSWLFEGALPHCTSEPRMVACGPSETPKVDAQVRKQVHWAHPPNPVESRDSNNVRLKKSRKSLRWSPDESDLLLELRRDRKLPWSDVTKLFSDQYPGRSQGSIQVYWSTSLKKRL